MEVITHQGIRVSLNKGAHQLFVSLQEISPIFIAPEKQFFIIRTIIDMVASSRFKGS